MSRVGPCTCLFPLLHDTSFFFYGICVNPALSDLVAPFYLTHVRSSFNLLFSRNSSSFLSIRDTIVNCELFISRLIIDSLCCRRNERNGSQFLYLNERVGSKSKSYAITSSSMGMTAGSLSPFVALLTVAVFTVMDVNNETAPVHMNKRDRRYATRQQRHCSCCPYCYSLAFLAVTRFTITNAND